MIKRFVKIFPVLLLVLLTSSVCADTFGVEQGALELDALHRRLAQIERSCGVVCSAPRDRAMLEMLDSEFQLLERFGTAVVRTAAGRLQRRVHALLPGESATLSKGGTSRIQGRVVLAVDQTALEGIYIAVQIKQHSTVAFTRTDADGRYEIQGLDSGDYYVQARPDSNLISQLYPATSCVNNCGNLEDANAISVDDGTVSTEIDFALEPGASIGGTVRGDDGLLLADVLVRAFDRYGNHQTESFTNAMGQFQLLGLAPNIYILCADANFSSLTYLGRFFSGPTVRNSCLNDPAGQGRQLVIDGPRAMGSIDFVLQSAGQVSGVATHSGGTPIQLPDSYGFVYLKDEAGQGVIADVVGFDAESGGYLISNVAPGRYYAGFASSIFPQSETSLPLFEQLHTGQRCPGLSCEFEGALFEVRAGEITSGIDFNLELGHRISGVVVRESDGKSQNAVSVALYDDQGRFSGRGFNLDGSWRSRGAMPSGTWFADTRTSSGQPGVPAPFRVQAYHGVDCIPQCDATQATPIQHDGQSDTDDIDFVIRRGGYLTGALVDGLENDAPDRVLQVLAYDDSGLKIAQVDSDYRGRYEFFGLPSGDYRILVEADGPYKTAVFGAQGCDPCSLQDGATVRVNDQGSTDSIDFLVPRVVDGVIIDANFSGPWYTATRPGHGWMFEVLEGSRLNAYWYVYQDGHPLWLVGQGDITGNTARLQMFATRGAGFPPQFNAVDVEVLTWGDLTVTLLEDDAGQVSWDPVLEGFEPGAVPVSRLAAIAPTGPESCRSGSYYNPDQSGHGFVVEVVKTASGHSIVLAWYVYLNGAQVWLLGQGPLENDSAVIPVIEYTGAGFPPAFLSEAVVADPWGTVRINFTGPTSAAVNWTTTSSDFSNGSLELVRLTTLSGHVCP